MFSGTNYDIKLSSFENSTTVNNKLIIIRERKLQECSKKLFLIFLLI